MKIKLIIIVFLINTSVFAQNKLEKLKQEAFREGVLLYESEKASWHGTDIFMSKFTDKAKIGGYFSYNANGKPTCVFYSNDEVPKVLGSISFDKSFDVNKAVTNLTSRDFTKLEREYYQLRENSKLRIQSDTIFKYYENTRFNVVPLITKGAKKVYVLTASTKNKTVLIGNDYLLEFDSANKCKKSERLHRSMLAFTYGDGSIAPAHNHLIGYSEVMTATDICTTMLYQHLTGWESHYVISKDYVSIWNCKTNTLDVMTHEDWEKLTKE